jgi:hypothetical protein
MDADLIESYRQKTYPHPDRTSSRSTQFEEWRATGLCPQAQADGVPCTELGRSCDICIGAGLDPFSMERMRP